MATTTIPSTLVSLALRALACLSLAAATCVQAAPRSTAGAPIGRIGSISGTITWPKAGNNGGGHTVTAYIAKLKPSTSPGTFGSTQYTAIKPAPAAELSAVVSKGGKWVQSYTLRNVSVGVPIAVFVDAKSINGSPSSGFIRTGNPQWANCTLEAAAVTRFDFVPETAIH